MFGVDSDASRRCKRFRRISAQDVGTIMIKHTLVAEVVAWCVQRGLLLYLPRNNVFIYTLYPRECPRPKNLLFLAADSV